MLDDLSASLQRAVAKVVGNVHEPEAKQPEGIRLPPHGLIADEVLGESLRKASEDLFRTERVSPSMFESLATQAPARVANVIRQVGAAREEFDKLAPEKIAALRKAAESGGEYDPHDLQMILALGSDEDRGAVGELFSTPEAVARSQDLVLPHMRAAMRGDKAARSFIETHRVVTEASMPAWLESRWKDEVRSQWRVLDLHSKVVRREARRLRSEVYPQYKEKWIPPLSVNPNCVSERRSLITYEIGQHGLSAYKGAEFRAMLGREIVFNVMRAEVELDQLRLNSPSVIGEFCRRVAKREVSYIFAAHLIDDAALTLDLPMSDDFKREVWDRTCLAPWKLMDSRIVKEGEAEARRLRALGLAGADLESAFAEEICKVIALQAPKTPQSSAVISASMQRAPAVEKVEVAMSVSELPARNKRLLFVAALESFSASSSDRDRQSRVLAKLVGDDPIKFEDAMSAVYRGEDVDLIIGQLRAGRPLSVLQGTGRPKESDPAGTPVMSASAFSAMLRSVPEMEQERPKIRYTPEAAKALRDGQLRHTAENLIEELIEKPDLADRKRIQNSHAWELRDHRDAVRVYYWSRSRDHLMVIFVGKKATQARDIPRVIEICDREMARA